jgi:hypothetical protein
MNEIAQAALEAAKSMRWHRENAPMVGNNPKLTQDFYTVYEKYFALMAKMEHSTES